PPLAPRDVAVMVLDRLSAADGGQIDAVQRWSEGNPLYVHEWCEWLRGGRRLDDEPESVPWRLEELADQAVDALDERRRAALCAAAVAAEPDGLSLEPAVVRYLLELPNWVSLVDELVAAGCLQRNGALVTFRHRVLWWVCRRRMLGSVRTELAARAAQAEELLARAT
ncbi:MAG: hypothetical protein HYU66_04985, partial [Armatimonadetes bacterium]|nr:hypothetical protein [Armatimonadota bacterium]